MSGHAFDDALTFKGSGGQYVLDVDDRWERRSGDVWGGFVLAIVVRAAGLVSSASRPLSMACQFLRPARVGVPIEASVVSLRRGRTNELLAVTLGQGGKTVTEAHVRAVDGGSGPVFEPVRRPVFGDPLSRPSTKEAELADGVEPAKFFDQVEAHDSRGPTEDCDAAGWWRLGPGITYEDPWLEAARLAMTADASGGAVSFRLAPAGQRRKQLPWGFSNIDELVHFHEAAGTEWLQIEVRILTGSGGYASAQCQTWSDEGKLLVTAISQLAFFELQGGSTLASDSTT